MEQNKRAGRPKKNASSSKTSGKKTAAKKISQGDIIFALDIGTRTIVGVLAKKIATGCEILDIETVAHEKRCMTDGQIEDIKTVAEDIKKVRRALEQKNHISLKSACIAAAGRALKTVRSSWEYKLEKEKMITDEILNATELDAVRRTCADFSAKNDAAAFYCVGHSVISLSLDGFKVMKP
ncbi:MAG: ATPase, partial [Oscillospiraceae bacterium]